MKPEQLAGRAVERGPRSRSLRMTPMRSAVAHSRSRVTATPETGAPSQPKKQSRRPRRMGEALYPLEGVVGQAVPGQELRNVAEGDVGIVRRPHARPGGGPGRTRRAGRRRLLRARGRCCRPGSPGASRGPGRKDLVRLGPDGFDRVPDPVHVSPELEDTEADDVPAVEPRAGQEHPPPRVHPALEFLIERVRGWSRCRRKATTESCGSSINSNLELAQRSRPSA